MLAKLLLHRNNGRRPSLFVSDPRRLEVVLRSPLLYRGGRTNSRRHRLKKLQRLNLSRFYSGAFPRMSCVKSENGIMLCDFCDQKASIPCPKCKMAYYCSKEHQKLDWKLHRRKCRGVDTLRTGEHFNESNGENYGVRDYIQTQAASVVENLYKCGYCFVDNFHGEDLAREILSEVKLLDRQGQFHDGQLVSSNGNGSTLNKKIREDRITWVEGKEENCMAISLHMTTVDTLIRHCNGLIQEYDVKNRTKAMVACYPGNGTGYKRHVDNPNQDGRCITTLYYLNPGWHEKKGGILKLFPNGCDQPVSIVPKLDRLLLFWSDRRNPHEVEPSFDIRYAITLWYFDAKEREMFRNGIHQNKNKAIEQGSEQRNQDPSGSNQDASDQEVSHQDKTEKH